MSSGGSPPTPTLWTDEVWIVDSTSVECGRSRQTTKRSALGGWARYGTFKGQLDLEQHGGRTPVGVAARVL
jgi:hypothetical protein